MKYFQNLTNYLNINNDFKPNSYEKIEININKYFYNNFGLLYNNNTPYLNYKILSVLDDKNFIRLCRYFLYVNNEDFIIKNNTQFNIIHKKEYKLIILLLTLNFVYYTNDFIQYNQPYDIFQNIDFFNDSILDNSILKKNKVLEKYLINKMKNICKNNIDCREEFKLLCEKIVLFISIVNCEKYDYYLPKDLIFYIFLGDFNIVKLNY